MKNAVVIQMLIFGVVVCVLVAFAARAGVFRRSSTAAAAKVAKTAKPAKAEKPTAPERREIRRRITAPEPAVAQVPTSGNPFLRTGGSSDHASAESLANRVMAEVVDAMLEHPTLVVWLFDQTASADRIQRGVAQRVEDNYRTLADMQTHGHEAFRDAATPPLMTVVGAFGKEVTFLTPETTDKSVDIGSALRQVREDGSGEERTFEAIHRAVTDFAKYRTSPRRMMMIVVVSDECGDDADRVDELVPLLDKHVIPLYVIGSPAPFGRDGTLSSFPAKENGPTISHGPESPGREWVNIDDWKASFDSQSIDAGFGPFALSRLAVKSGGAYFPVRADSSGSFGGFSSRDSVRRFDSAAMARYKPDYLSKAAFNELIQSNKAAAALYNAGQLPRVTLSSDLTLEFVKKDEAGLKRLLDKAQQGAARMEPQIRQMYTALAAGENDRASLTSPRLQAGYDLAMGRALAARARVEGYNAYLAQLKQGKSFPKEGQTTWILTPNDTFEGDSTLEKLIKQTRTYLERVNHDHPNTPWAYMASHELAVPMGWKWESR